MSTQKKIKPVYTVDLTNAKTAEDFIMGFVKAQSKANQPVNWYNLRVTMNTIMDHTVDAVIEDLFSQGNTVTLLGDTLLRSNAVPAFIPSDSYMGISNGKITIRKKNIFKRFWNWITRKNK